MVRSKRNKKKSTKNYELPLSNPHTQSLEMCVKVKTQPASGPHNLTNLEVSLEKKTHQATPRRRLRLVKKTSKINIFRGPLDFNQFKRLLWLVFSLSFRWTLGVSRVKRYGKFIMKKLLCFFSSSSIVVLDERFQVWWISDEIFKDEKFHLRCVGMRVVVWKEF